MKSSPILSLAVCAGRYGGEPRGTALRKSVWWGKQERKGENTFSDKESLVTLVVPKQDAIKDVLCAWDNSKLRWCALCTDPLLNEMRPWIPMHGNKWCRTQPYLIFKHPKSVNWLLYITLKLWWPKLPHWPCSPGVTQKGSFYVDTLYETSTSLCHHQKNP